MSIDSTPKPCLHKRANHQHGTALAFAKDGCHCPPCTAAHRRHAKATQYRTLTGTHTYVPADRARAHAQQLLEVLTVGQVEQRSGVHRTAIRVLVGDFPGRPASKRITRGTESALLAVTDDRVGGEKLGLVDGTGTRRRFRALIAAGWPAKWLQQRTEFTANTSRLLVSPAVPDGTPVRVATREAIRRLYDDLALEVPPPSRQVTRARHIAAARGWAPPLAWDDDTIDDPAARSNRGHTLEGTSFDEVAVQRALHGDDVHLRPVERAEVVHRLTAQGLSAAEIAPRVGIDKRSVQRIRDERRRAEEAA